MVLRRMTVGLLLVSLFAGCSNRPKKTTLTADSTTIMRVRNEVQQLDPEARVGQVIEVKPDENAAAIGDVPAAEFKVGDIVTFMDGNKETLTTGKVIRVLSDALHVRYDVPLPPGRVPVVGDLMIRFK